MEEVYILEGGLYTYDWNMIIGNPSYLCYICNKEVENNNKFCCWCCDHYFCNECLVKLEDNNLYFNLTKKNQLCCCQLFVEKYKDKHLLPLDYELLIKYSYSNDLDTMLKYRDKYLNDSIDV